MRSVLLLIFAAGVSPALVFLGGCSDSQGPPPLPNGGGSTSMDGSASDGSTSDGGTLMDPGAPAPFDAGSTCLPLEAWHRQCNPSDACGAQIASQCGTIDDVLGAAATQAITTCYGASSCTSTGPLSAMDALLPCVTQQIANLQPTASQAQLLSDYCGLCGVDGGACAFLPAGGLSLPLANTQDGLSAYYLLFSDDIADQVDTTCTCVNTCGDFAACAYSIYAAGLAPFACGTAPDAAAPLDSGAPLVDASGG